MDSGGRSPIPGPSRARRELVNFRHLCSEPRLLAACSGPELTGIKVESGSEQWNRARITTILPPECAKVDKSGKSGHSGALTLFSGRNLTLFQNLPDSGPGRHLDHIY